MVTKISGLPPRQLLLCAGPLHCLLLLLVVLGILQGQEVGSLGLQASLQGPS